MPKIVVPSMSMIDDPMDRIALALERMSPPPADTPDFDEAAAFLWHVEPDRLAPVQDVNGVALDLLIGIERARDTLHANTLQFAKGFAANNALLWGSRGMGKSSLVKAVHGDIVATGLPLKLVEVQREDLPSIGRLLNLLRASDHRFVLYCAGGQRSALAAKALQDIGYGNVAHLEVGFNGWAEAGGAVEPVTPPSKYFPGAS